MKKTVVIYSSKYGYTKRYAGWIGESLGCPVLEKGTFKPETFDAYDTIIYGGGLYAGSVNGIRLLKNNAKRLLDKRLVLFTCGLADPTKPETIAQIDTVLAGQLPPELRKRCKVFYLRGGMDYARLGFMHRNMMAMLQKMLLKKDPASRTMDDQGLLDTYGKHVDFTDRDSLKPLLEYLTH